MSVEQRLEQLQQAAALPSIGERVQFLADGDYQRACSLDWDDSIALENAATEINARDVFLQEPLRKDDVVVLSDGHCYSRESIRQWLATNIAGGASGRIQLPATYAEVTDEDYVRVGLAPPSARQLSDARMLTYNALYGNDNQSEQESEEESEEVPQFWAVEEQFHEPWRPAHTQTYASLGIAEAMSEMAHLIRAERYEDAKTLMQTSPHFRFSEPMIYLLPPLLTRSTDSEPDYRDSPAAVRSGTEFLRVLYETYPRWKLPLGDVLNRMFAGSTNHIKEVAYTTIRRQFPTSWEYQGYEYERDLGDLEAGASNNPDEVRAIRNEFFDYLQARKDSQRDSNDSRGFRVFSDNAISRYVSRSGANRSDLTNERNRRWPLPSEMAESSRRRSARVRQNRGARASRFAPY
jgi:hypothetical protein